MLQQLRSRLTGRRFESQDGGASDEDGFTLIELMVVVLIIAILIAIAIPTFLGARQKAQDRAAQSNLRNGLTAAKTAYVDSQSYASDVASGVYHSIEPSLTFANGAVSAPGQISVTAPADDTLIIASHSASGECFYVKDVTGASSGVAAAGTTYAKQSASSCNATDSGLTFTQTW